MLGRIIALLMREGVLYFNPGSCGPQRFRLPVTVGLLTVGQDGELLPKIVNLFPIPGS